MPVLVRWQQDEGCITVRCTEVRRHPLLPEHLQLLGVRGANDPEHPDLQVLALAVRAADVVYLCDCVPAPAAQGLTSAAPPAPSPPATAAPSVQPAPAQAPQRARRARTRPE